MQKIVRLDEAVAPGTRKSAEVEREKLVRTSAGIGNRQYRSGVQWHSTDHNLGAREPVHHDPLPGFGFGPKTMVELIRHRANVSSLDVCFRFLVDGENEEEIMTFADLDRRARRIAAWLQSHGMQGQ